MVTRRTRAHLALPLTLVLLPLLLWATGATTSRPSTATSWTQLHAKSPTAFQSVRTHPFDAPSHHPVATPHPSFTVVAFAVPAHAANDVAPAGGRPPRAVVTRQHPARAPPAIA